MSASLAVMYPFFTGRLIGGVDARWYGYMLADYIDQVRHGALLVTVGQGQFAWNGAVHPFRSAPVYMMVARLCDMLTLQRLNAFALQHLTVIVSALVGTLGFYFAAVRIMPRRRWLAAGVALIYLTTPSWLSTVLCSEAYMSYMAFAAMPVVLYGNARTALWNDGRGYVLLGSGLALIWMCHPPIAFITTIATIVFQVCLVVTRGVVSWRSLAAGAAAFAVLAAFYFVSMSEIPATPSGNSRGHELIEIVGLAAFFAGMGRFGVAPKYPAWAGLAALGLAVVWMTNAPWLCWALASAAVWIACVLAMRRWSPESLGRNAGIAFFASVFAGAAIAEAKVGRDGIYTAPLLMFAQTMADVGGVFRPLATQMQASQIFQPGWALIVLFAAGICGLFSARPAAAKLFFATSFGLGICFLRFPLVSNFIVGRFPIELEAMCGVPLALRITPVLVSFTAMAGVMWIATSEGSSSFLKWAVGPVVLALVVWSGWQVVPFVVHSKAVTAGEVGSANNLRPENSILDAYAYLLLPIPIYYSNGKMDAAIETRVLGKSGEVKLGPLEYARILERKNGDEVLHMRTDTIPNSTNWFAVEPGITVKPGEHLLLRFEFDARKNYAGYFLLESKDSYREYHLPDSGSEMSFGVGKRHVPVLSLWNTGATPEHYKLSLSTETGNDIEHKGAYFADVHVSRLDAEALPVTLKSLLPYEAHVRTEAGGTLETFRDYMPGYRARIDGAEAKVSKSETGLLALEVPPGSHEVVVWFAGTFQLWAAAVVSGLGWLALLVWCVVKRLCPHMNSRRHAAEAR